MNLKEYSVLEKIETVVKQAKNEKCWIYCESMCLNKIHISVFQPLTDNISPSTL